MKLSHRGPDEALSVGSGRSFLSEVQTKLQVFEGVFAFSYSTWHILAFEIFGGVHAPTSLIWKMNFLNCCMHVYHIFVE